MYEDQTYEVILQRMLDRVPADIDKREGSIIYDALAPAAVELAEAYAEMDAQINLAFAGTSSGEYLDLRVDEFGIIRKSATKAIRKGLFYDSGNNPIDVPISNRFSLSGVNYVVIEKTATGVYKLECETAGIVGNQDFGSILPIEYITGLSRAELSDVLDPGEDEETDSALIERFLTKVRSPGTSGNKADYMNWALEVSGVGGAQVLPLWNGAGSVKVVLIDTEKQPADLQLVQAVQYYIAPTSGLGEGKAPIGATVTVEAATGVNIDISATVMLDGSKTLAEVQTNFESELISYLKSIAFTSDPSVKYVRIGSMLLDISGVTDYSNLLINDGISNITINTGQVAVKGTVTLS